MLIYETENWLLKQRADCKLPGYLILAAKNAKSSSLAALLPSALNELGQIQSHATSFLQTLLGAELVYICKWGHLLGNAPHFHIVPLYKWLKESYKADQLWREFEPEPDGPIYFAYITRAFVEYKRSPSIEGPSINEAFQTLRKAFLSLAK